MSDTNRRLDYDRVVKVHVVAPLLGLPCSAFRLIEQASCGCSIVRGGGELKVRARLCRWHSGAECLPPGHGHHSAPANGFALQRSHHPALRHEQACGCSTVCNGGGLKVRARLCYWHSGAECLPPARSGTCRWFGFATKPPSSSPTDRASLRRILRSGHAEEGFHSLPGPRIG